MAKTTQHETYSEPETQRRFDAALRGSRIAGPRHNESLTPKRARKQRRKTGSKTLSKAEQASLRREMQEASALGRKAFGKRGKK
jgi:hypothetical protein